VNTGSVADRRGHESTDLETWAHEDGRDSAALSERMWGRGRGGMNTHRQGGSQAWAGEHGCEGVGARARASTGRAASKS